MQSRNTLYFYPRLFLRGEPHGTRVSGPLEDLTYRREEGARRWIGFHRSTAAPGAVAGPV